MMVAVVDHVGLKANWSEKDNVAGGVRIAGYMYCLTTIFSRMRVKTGVIDIGR